MDPQSMLKDVLPFQSSPKRAFLKMPFSRSLVLMVAFASLVGGAAVKGEDSVTKRDAPGPSADASRSPTSSQLLKKYKEAVNHELAARWYYYMNKKMDELNTSTVTLSFSVDAKGVGPRSSRRIKRGQRGSHHRVLEESGPGIAFPSDVPRARQLPGPTRPQGGVDEI
jgi:hypothetical protein